MNAIMRWLKSCLVRAWLIWVIAAIFYAYEFFIRISPSVMVSELMQSFGINAALLGTVSAFYYYAYASMQIPVGILLDRYGIRHLLTAAAVLVVIGTFLFASTHNPWVAAGGRVLMGVGSAFSFVGCLKLANNWFDKRKLAVIIGLTNMLGVLGAIGAEAPLSMLVQNSGWRPTMLAVGFVGAIFAMLIRFVVRDDPRELGCIDDSPSQQEQNHSHRFFEGLKRVLSSPHTWVTALYGGFMVAPISAFTELWSVPFFGTVDHIPTTEAAFVSSIVFIGIAIGGPVNGWLSGVFQRRKPLMIVGNILAIICLSSVLFIPNLPDWLLGSLLFFFGFFTSTMLLAFAINTERNPDWASGVAIGFTNMIVMLGGTIFQPLVGWLLDQGVRHPGIHGHWVFSIQDFHHALLILPLVQVGAFIMLMFTRETFCKSQCIQ